MNPIQYISAVLTCGLIFISTHFTQGEDLYFSTLSAKDGLPSNIIAGIAQDNYDFLWIGTGSGLARYDGNKVIVFKKNQSEKSLPSNELTSIVSYEDDVWIGTWNGLCKINVKTFEITRIDLSGNNEIRSLFIGQDDILWIGTAKGLLKYNIKTSKFQTFNDGNSHLSHNTIRCIYEDKIGNLWVGTYDGLNVLRQGESAFKVLDLRKESPTLLKNHLILDIKPKKEGNGIWVGTETGLFFINTSSNAIEKFDYQSNGFSNNVIKCIYSDQQNRLWLGTDFGLNIYLPNGPNQALFHNPAVPYSIANNVVWQIFEDTGGVIWLVTSNGLSRVNKYGNYYSYHDISYEIGDQVIGNQVKSFLISQDGNYWMATNHGLIRFHPNKNEKEIFNTSSPVHKKILLNNVFDMEEDRNGNIWIGTSAGINIWNRKKMQMSSISVDQKNGLESNYIGKFSLDPEGNIWVSAWQGGLYKVIGNSLFPENITFLKVPKFESGSEKHTYGSNNLWTVENDQLYKINPKDLTSLSVIAFNEISINQTIYSIYFSKRKHLWACTLNGLIQYIPETDEAIFHSFSTSNEMIINSIQEDDLGNIWSISNSALYKIEISGLNIKVFPLDKNLPIKSFFYGCATSNTFGQLIFGGDNGYIVVNPALAEPNNFKPAIYITSLEINNENVTNGKQINDRVLLNKDIAFANQLELDFSYRSVTFEFSSLHYWQPEMNTFKYKLEGFDRDWWSVSGQKNFATYSNLPSGKYFLRVKGTNNYGLESSQEAKIGLIIKPPLFLSATFILIYVVLILSIIYYLLRAYRARLILKNALQITRIEKEHAIELEKTKEKFFTNISHELRTPISLILPPIHQIQSHGQLDAQSDRLIDLAEKNAQRLLRLVNQILDFNKLENDTLHLKVNQREIVAFCKEVFSLFQDKADRQQIDFIFDSTIDQQEIWIDVDKIETVLFNLLSNAFKFTANKGQIKLSLKTDISEKYKEGILLITVSDNGIGIPQEEHKKIFERFYQSNDGKLQDSSTGIGLTMVAEYIELHHGEIKLNSEYGKGTSITFSLPLGNMHLPIDTVKPTEEIRLLATRSVHGPKYGSGNFQIDLASDKPMILVIEDNNEIMEFIRNSLQHKYNIVTAENGLEGFQKASSFLPQVIISDIMMPVMDGLTLCKKIKENPKTSYTSIILLTAKSLTSHHIEGINIGADAYITKPFEIDLLEAHIDQLISRRKELTEYFRNDLIRLPPESDESNNEDNKFVKKVMDIIEANISNSELTVEMISREMAMSPTHLYRRLKSTTDHSAKEIIQKYRLKKASLMMQNKEGNITEIMYQVGFSSLSYFSNCFKAEYKMSPKQYLDQMNQKIRSE